MLSLLLYTLSAFGLAYVVGHSKISLPFRVALEPAKKVSDADEAVGLALGNVSRWWLLMLLECPACLGFWIGLGYGLWNTRGWIASLGLGLFTCGTNLLLAKGAGLTEEGVYGDGTN